jgi:hypothetical protein
MGRSARQLFAVKPPGPEHFAAVATRHFVHLREMTMTATAEPSPVGAHFDTYDPEPLARPTLPSAAEHYAAACGALADADSNGYNLAEAARLHKSAQLHLKAASLAMEIWPVYLDKLHAAIDAARALLESTPAAEEASAAKLAEALRQLDAA